MQINLAKKLSLFMLTMFIFSLFSYSVFAGTLVSGNQVAVTSNNNEISGKYNLVGTWSTTPTAADSIIITNSQLPAPYGLTSQLVIDVPQPTFEQKFSVDSQQPVYQYSLWSSDLYFFSDYQSKIDSQFNKEHPGAYVILSKLSCGALNCNGYKVYASSQKGWVGQVSNAGINYNQKINLNGVGTITLSTTSATPSLSGTLPGIAIVRLLGFSSWTNALLSDKNVYAFHSGSSTSVGSWQPFSDNGQYYIPYVSTLNDLKNVLNTGGTCILNSCFTSKFNSAIAAANTQSDLLIAASNNFPSSWQAIGNQVGSHSSSYSMFIPLDKPVLTANLQLILNGEKFGLFVPTGTPAINSIDTSLTFSETASANLNYVAQNIGQSSGSFQTSLNCPSGKISGQADVFVLGAGEKVTKKMYVTAKTDSNTDLSETCTFTLQESTSGAKVTKSVGVKVTAKANCAQGQQSDPYVSGILTVVDIYDSSCKIIDQVKCTTASQDIKLSNGVYTCANKQGISGQGATNFSMPLFISALIVGAILAGVVYSNIRVISFGKYTKIAVTVITIVSFVFGIMATVWVVNAVRAYFSI